MCFTITGRVVCVYQYLVLAVRVLHVFHNNWSGGVPILISGGRC